MRDENACLSVLGRMVIQPTTPRLPLNVLPFLFEHLSFLHFPLYNLSFSIFSLHLISFVTLTSPFVFESTHVPSQEPLI